MITSQLCTCKVIGSSIEDCEIHGTIARFARESSDRPWNFTYTGRKVNPLDLKVEDICIEDIAHHLATFNRWGGALREPISVAQHSWHVSYLLEGTGDELEGLMHDDDEAYLGDMIKWLKQSPIMAPFRAAGQRAHEVCAAALGYSPIISPLVEVADKRMIAIEGDFGMRGGWVEIPGYPVPLASEVKQSRFDGAWHWRVTEQRFLERYEELQFQRRNRCLLQR